MSCRRRWARRKYEVVSARGCLHDYSQLYGASWGRWRGGGGGGQECAESLRGHVRAILKLQKNHGVVIVSIGPHYGSWGVERGDMQLPGHLPGWQYMSRPKDMAQAPQRLRILFPNQKPTFGTSLNCISLECALFDPPPPRWGTQPLHYHSLYSARNISRLQSGESCQFCINRHSLAPEALMELIHTAGIYTIFTDLDSYCRYLYIIY